MSEIIGQLDVRVALVESDSLSGAYFGLTEVEVMEQLPQMLERKHINSWSINLDWEGEQKGISKIWPPWL